MYFLYNPLILVNEPHEFLLIIETLGDTKCTLEISIPNYVLVNEQITFSNQNIFENIAKKDLKKVINKMNLKNAPELQKDYYFHVLFKNTLTNIGLQSITILIRNHQTKDNYYLRTFNAMVYAKNGYCLPKVSSEDCKTPSNPQSVLYYQFNSFKPIVERKCSKSSKLIYKWSVNHLLDTSKFS